jgi:pyridoxamine 5'-phosphate oxidase
MINFINDNSEKPYIIFRKKYNSALKKNQPAIEAISISSYSLINSEVDSRYVNLKYVDDKEFIFFTNYNSPKSAAFDSHDQITALIYWSSINVQIRMKAQIKKTSKEFNQKYFYERSKKKNALAISSNQSKQIDSYNQVKENYNIALNKYNLKKCPDYWGGFSFIPYYFEFWEGDDSRINKREVFEKSDGRWICSFLQP